MHRSVARGLGPELSDTEESSGWVGHSFDAVRTDTFRDAREFRRDIDCVLRYLRECPRAEGAQRIYYAGQKESVRVDECPRLGVPLPGKTFGQICEIGNEFDAVLLLTM